MIINPNTGINATGGGPKSRTADNEVVGAGQSTPKTDGDKQGSGGSKPEVSLSAQAQTLSRLQNQIDVAPEIDSNRVAQIQKAIADGTFQIDADSIAAKMLDQDDQLA